MTSSVSPCVLVCSIDLKTGYCFGCGRNKDEIAGWMNYSAEQRIEVNAKLADRLQQIERRPRRETKRKRMRRERGFE